MGLREVSAILWRERHLLELLLFKLDEEQLVLAAGRTRWLPRATREVEMVLEEIRQTELERLEGSWEHLSEADRARVEALTKGIVNKLLHEPTVRVRAAAEDGDGEALRHLESLRHLFGLEAQANS